MFLKKLQVMNLWDERSVELDFDKQVTVLTGMNGSGKSSILNIIYDSLKLRNGDDIATSKNRLWLSECHLDCGVSIQSLILPPVEDEKRNLVEKIIHKHNKKIHTTIYNEKLLEEIKATYEDSDSSNHVIFAKKNARGQGYIHGIGFPLDYSEEKRNARRDELKARPNAFLFQEDRKVMHNLENSNIDPKLEFWDTYSSSIDTRFFYIRDAMQIRESQIDAERSKIFDQYEEDGGLDTVVEDENYKLILSKKKAISDLFNLLNEYFYDSGKMLVKDKDDNKLTLKYIDKDESISWHLLSRGEKTLMYIFLATFLYKDKTSLFLFDEPDVTLHVKWQERLLKDISALAPDNQFIIATHSPSLVMRGWMSNCLTIKV